jgi:hypothetical protein
VCDLYREFVNTNGVQCVNRNVPVSEFGLLECTSVYMAMDDTMYCVCVCVCISRGYLSVLILTTRLKLTQSKTNEHIQR